MNLESSKKVRSFAMKEQSQSSEDSDMGVFINGTETSGNHFERRSKKNEESVVSETSTTQNKSQQIKSAKNSDVSLCNVNNDLSSENVGNKQRNCESEGDSPRRASNDSATSNSDSQQSGDEYNVYYFAKTTGPPEATQPPGKY